MKFKPTKIKTIISLTIGFLFGLFFYWVFRFRMWVPGPGPIEQGLLVLIITWLITFIILYLIISLFQKTKT